MTAPLPRRLALLSLPIAALALAGKLVAWHLSHGSLALLADALETTANLATAALTLWALWLAAQPADAGHPYGHHKAEYIAAAATGLFIVGSGILILYDSLPALLAALHHSSGFTLPLPTLLIAALVTLINAAWGVVLYRQGTAKKSPALVADAQHLGADVVTTGGTLLGLVLAQQTGWGLLDPLLATVVSLHILFTGGKVIYHATNNLLDAALPADSLHKIEALLAATVADPANPALNIHDLKTRQAARATFIEFHLVVPGTMSVAASHTLCDQLEVQLHKRIPGSQITIHVEPEAELPPQK